MTLSEFYSSLDESLDEVLERLRMESRVAKYLKLFLSDPSFTELKEAFAGNDAQTAFRAAHTLKGVAANLGLNKLSASSSELTEDLRPGAFTANSQALFEKVERDYSAAVEGIKQLE
ncbi:MAG: Hpt domain-containing protein [Fibrobacter sp.]|uniref:Hpt domain-containing protein n=1 Tax=Fibrobacter sp. TaxID=35828 RepID=UPI0025B9AE4D|nr:Hpt domain-containing protein [Fibrobacter sp.]MBQ7079589.1 Hpt domain-containing protein [Fibrobacter sp.]